MVEWRIRPDFGRRRKPFRGCLRTLHPNDGIIDAVYSPSTGFRQPLRYLLALMLAIAGSVAAQEPARLNELLAVCASCHGQDGVALGEEIPSLGGQNEAYLVQALKDFRDGKRPSAIMRGIARELREDDIRTLARHYAAKPYQRKAQSIDADRISRGSEVYQRLCQICHLDEGRNTTYAEYPLLAGQSLPYMRRQMQLILDRRRSVEITKQGMLALLSPAQIDDAIHFFASRQVLPDQVGSGVTGEGKPSRRRRFRSEPRVDPDSAAE